MPFRGPACTGVTSNLGTDSLGVSSVLQARKRAQGSTAGKEQNLGGTEALAQPTVPHLPVDFDEKGRTLCFKLYGLFLGIVVLKPLGRMHPQSF